MREYIATCQHCGRPVKFGQPYMGRIPFVGTRGGIVHRFCLRLVSPIRGGSDCDQVAR